MRGLSSSAPARWPTPQLVFFRHHEGLMFLGPSQAIQHRYKRSKTQHSAI